MCLPVLVRRVVEDAIKNVHPIYHIKMLIIKRELAKAPKYPGLAQNPSRVQQIAARLPVQVRRVVEDCIRYVAPKSPH